VNDVVVAGSRGWMLPPVTVRSSAIYCATTNEVELGNWTENDEKILAREIGRLTLSLDAAKKLFDANCTLLVAMHYPPIYPDGTDSPFTELLEQHEPKVVFYGHLHVANPDEIGNATQSEIFDGQRGATNYRLVSADYIGFQPVRIL
jgi:hypothetical protein